jgi:ATP-dependent helicase Lhr and Lhr-like helicase
LSTGKHARCGSIPLESIFTRSRRDSAREAFPFKWRELLRALGRLEARGEVRGGRFVDGFLGEQFALPLAVESLRASLKIGPSEDSLILSAVDPLNLIGIIIPGQRVPAISGKSVIVKDGVAIADALKLAAVS